MDAKGNTILITGGGSGIGLALARRLVDGTAVIVCGRDEERAAEWLARIAPGGAFAAMNHTEARPAGQTG